MGWDPRIEYVSFPDRWDGGGSGAAGEFTDGIHELDKAGGIAHCVVETEGEDEPAAFQARNLYKSKVN